METSGRSKHIFGLILAACLAVLSVAGWIVVSDKSTGHTQLVANFGEIKRIDEILTSSALMATATGDPVYKLRYDAHVDELDHLINQTMALFDQPSVRDLMAQVETANKTLVSIEVRALGAAQDGPNSAAYKLLTSADYHSNKRIYSQGIERTFVELRRIAEEQMFLTRFALVGILIAFALSLIVASRLIWRSQIEAIERANQSNQVHMMSAMIRTFMDVQNNLLNNMVYFRTKAAHNLPFDDQEVTLIDREIDLAKEKLAEIAKTDLAQTRDLGGIVVMVKDAPQQCSTPEYANAA